LLGMAFSVRTNLGKFLTKPWGESIITLDTFGIYAISKE